MPGRKEIARQVPDTSGDEEGTISTSKEVDLVIQVKEIVIDRCGGEQNQLFSLVAKSTASVVGREDAFEVLVALRGMIAEIVTLIDKQQVSIGHLMDIIALASEHFLCNNGHGNARLCQFFSPHL